MKQVYSQNFRGGENYRRIFSEKEVAWKKKEDRAGGGG